MLASDDSRGSPAGPPAPRLNPFAFPSDTDFRFVLLIVSVLGVGLLIYSMLYNAVPANWERHRAVEERCRQESERAFPGQTLADTFGRTGTYARCMAPADRRRAAWMIGGLAVLLGIAAAIYWTYPDRKIKRDRLEAISAEDAAEVVACLDELRREAGLTRAPAFLWNPLNLTSSGVAFGRLGRYHVALTGGLVAQFGADPDAFRAVVRHELAHLRNADVDKTYFAVAVWQAFLVAALLPVAITLLDNPPREILAVGWRLAALAALVYLTRNAVLRAREFYADVRASVWDGPSGALRRVLDALPRPKDGGPEALLRVHPDPGERRRAVDDPGRLFRLGFWDALGAGVAAGIALPNVKFLLSLAGPALPPFASALGSAFVFAPLAAGVAGAGVWRMAFAARARGDALRGVKRLATGLGLGLVAGQYLSLVAVGYAQSPVALTGAGRLVFELAWDALLIASLAFFLQWIAAGASAWLDVALAGPPPRPFYRTGLVLGGAILAVWLGLLFYVDAVRAAGGSIALSMIREHTAKILAMPVSEGPALYGLLAAVVALRVLSDPLTLVIVTALWAFPLSAWVWTRRVCRGAEPHWAFLDGSGDAPALPDQDSLNPKAALRTGAAAGLAFAVLSLLLFRALATPGKEIPAPAVAGQVVIGALLQIITAALVAARAKRIAWVHALFAVYVAGGLMGGGAVTAAWLASGQVSAEGAWLAFSVAVNGGTLLALPVALLVPALRGTPARGVI